MSSCRVPSFCALSAALAAFAPQTRLATRDRGAKQSSESERQHTRRARGEWARFGGTSPPPPAMMRPRWLWLLLLCESAATAAASTRRQETNRGAHDGEQATWERRRSIRQTTTSYLRVLSTLSRSQLSTPLLSSSASQWLLRLWKSSVWTRLLTIRSQHTSGSTTPEATLHLRPRAATAGSGLRSLAQRLSWSLIRLCLCLCVFGLCVCGCVGFPEGLRLSESGVGWIPERMEAGRMGIPGQRAKCALSARRCVVPAGRWGCGRGAGEELGR